MALKEEIRRKANVLLLITLVVFALISVRLAHLTLVQHRHYTALSKRPQHKTLIEEANRGTILDAKGNPLAINQMRYNAAIIFDDIRSVPKVKNKVKVRRNYIEALAKMLSEKLGLDPLFIEDTIYSHASIFPNTPFVLKEGISERKYHELRMLERKWPGLKAQIVNVRTYPQGKTGCNILGYMGAINHHEHIKLSYQINQLREFLTKRESGIAEALPPGFDSLEEVMARYRDLKEKAYSITSLVGKAGVEKQFNDQLRGQYGKRKYEVDTNGHQVRELPDSYASHPGMRFTLNIDSELQAFAEELLTSNEERRDQRFRIAGKNHNLVHPPWIKGGAIIVMDPKSGQVLTMASYPRFDPNDFIFQGSDEEKNDKRKAMNKWLETPRYIGSIWDGTASLEREVFSLTKGYHTQEEALTWNLYLEMILSKESKVKEALYRIPSIQVCLHLQHACHELLTLCDGAEMHSILDQLYDDQPSRLTIDPITLQYTQDRMLQHMARIQDLKGELDPYLVDFDNNDDRLLFLDLCRLCVPYPHFSQSLADQLDTMTLETYRKLTQTFCSIEPLIKPQLAKLFHDTTFLEWRNTHFKAYLKQKRKEEKELKRYQKPYLEYLNAKEKEMFETFFQENRWAFYRAFLSMPYERDNPLRSYTKLCSSLFYANMEQHAKIKQLRKFLRPLSKQHAQELIQTFVSFEELKDPLWGRYPLKEKGHQTLRHLAAHFYPFTGFGYSRSYAFQEAAPQGSIFKIVTAFEALNQNYARRHKIVNPLTIIDQSNPKSRERQSQILGYHTDGRKITRSYRGGRLPASYKKTGKVDLLSAFELSSNIYFSLLASDVLKSPLDLTRSSRRLSLGKKTGIDLPGEIQGLLPNDVMDNRTGLYSLAIGQHTLVVSPLQTATMLSTIANGGNVYQPQVVQSTTLEAKSMGRNLRAKEYKFKHYLNLIGLDFPFFSEAHAHEKEKRIEKHQPALVEQIEYPKEVKHYLLKGLDKVVNGKMGSARTIALHSLLDAPKDKRTYIDVKKSMVGKTATAEILYRPCLDRTFKPIICKHIWFSAASFHSKKGTNVPNYEDPELVVVVYLRFGDFGKEAAPIAAKMIDRYRQLKKHDVRY